MPTKTPVRSPKSKKISPDLHKEPFVDETHDDNDISLEKVNYLTQEWYEKLTEEKKNILEIQMPMVMDRVKEARSFGDLSENADYEQALSDKELLETRLVEIEWLLTNVEIITHTNQKGLKEVINGCQVTLQTPDGEIHLRIVGSGEIEFEEEMGQVSFESPIGKAIFGKAIGDKAIVKSEWGRYEVEIIAIK